MRDVKSPSQGAGVTTALAAPTLAQWLTSIGLKDLLGAVLEADQHEPWTCDSESGPLVRDMHALGVALSNAAPADGHDRLDATAADLIYLLAFLPTSQCLRLLFDFNACLPGVAERLLTCAMESNAQGSPEALILSNRLLYWIRQVAARHIFSRARRAEVLAAVIAVRS